MSEYALGRNRPSGGSAVWSSTLIKIMSWFIRPSDVSNVVLSLASDGARYIAGMRLRIDPRLSQDVQPSHLI